MLSFMLHRNLPFQLTFIYHKIINVCIKTWYQPVSRMNVKHGDTGRIPNDSSCAFFED